MPALTMGALHQRRCQGRLFSWIQGHLPIRHFPGNSKTASRTRVWRVWCGVATCVFTAITRQSLCFEHRLSSPWPPRYGS